MNSTEKSRSNGRRVGFVDTTLRDAHQSLWATRMTTAMMLPVCGALNRAGFDCVDLMGLVHFDVCVRYLKENPWERIRLVRERIVDVPLKSWLRSNSLIGFDVLPQDVNALWVERLVENGVGIVCAFDALADLDNIIPNLLLAKKLGAKTCGALVFCESPVHTDEFYTEKARELVDRGKIDWIMIKDSGGLLGIDRVRTLVPAIRATVGDIPIELHSHCMTGLAPLVYHEGVKLGVDIVDTSIAPLADGPAQPATQTMVANLRSMGFRSDVDLDAVREVSEHIRLVAANEGKPHGVPMPYDAFHYEHQLPGGMLTNLQYQLETVGIPDRFDQVLEETARIRQELAWPIMVTPFAQLVCTQAVLNVIHGERYKIVPDEVKKYALGYYGKLMAPIDGDLLDRIVTNGSDRIAVSPQQPDPAVDRLRRKYAQLSDEERLLRFCFAGTQVDDMLAAGPIRTAYSFQRPLERLLRELTQRRRWTHISLEKADLKLTIRNRQHGGDAVAGTRQH